MKKIFPILIVVLLGLAVTQFLQQSRTSASSLTVYCAAGLKQIVEPIARAFEEETGIQISLQYGGSGTLLTQLQVAKVGDLFIAADHHTIEDARAKGLIDEVLPIAEQFPVIAVGKGNPKNIRSIEDLLREDIKMALPNAEAPSAGKISRAALGQETWQQLESAASVIKPTVTEIIADIIIGAVDAAIVWNTTVPQFQDTEAVIIPVLESHPEPASIAVLKSTEHSASALNFARYLTAPNKGNATFQAAGFKSLPADPWVATPELLLFSGGVNRPAIEQLVQAFADREGVSVTTVFNGCGILCDTIKALTDPDSNQMPDAYYACDVCFVPPVAEHFPEAVLLTETEIVIAKPKTLDKTIRTLADLAQPDLKVGICNAEQSTLGFMTDAILRSTNLLESVMKNVVVQVPTADFLVNQMRTGALDVAIVYKVNVQQVAQHFDIVPLPPEMAKAVQPFAVRAASPNYHLGQRLLSFLRENPEPFTKAGFIWKGETAPIPSDQLEIPDYLKGAGQ